MKQSIGNFLLHRLEEVGIHLIFGVPGDYNLELMQQLEDRGKPACVGNCNELNSARARRGHATPRSPLSADRRSDARASPDDGTR
ncbi:MAG: Pyruvate decarboxylase [Acidobacteria bacterium]|nr:Pyruvate decarboxylase [Acidobacteriota bacterium]